MDDKPKQPHHTKTFAPKDRRTSRQHPLQQVFTNAHAAARNRGVKAKISLAPVGGLDDDRE